MALLTTDQIDRELASRVKEVDAMSATLVELDNHPGLAHVRRYPPVGITGQRWPAVEASLGRLWEDLGAMTAILQSAQVVRARRSKINDDDRAELTRLLRDRPIEVSRERIPLAERMIGSPGEKVHAVGLAEVAERMQTAYPAVVEFLDAIDQINSHIAAGLSDMQKRLGESRVAEPPEVAELLQLSATDPLSLTAREVDARIAVIAENVRRRATELAEQAVLRADWPAALAMTAAELDSLRDATGDFARVRQRVEHLVLSGPIPVSADIEPDLRAQLQAFTTADPAALAALRRRIALALEEVRHGEQLAQGLLDRRNELKGRLSAYEAKAARLGLGEDRDLLASGQIAAGLLSRRPCDLWAVTRAIADYRQLLSEKRGQS